MLYRLRFRRSGFFPEKYLFAVKPFDGYLVGSGPYRKPLSGKTDFAQTFNRLLREGSLGDISSLELIFMDNSKSARVVRIIAPLEPTIIHVVDYHTWITIVT